MTLDPPKLPHPCPSCQVAGLPHDPRRCEGPACPCPHGVTAAPACTCGLDHLDYRGPHPASCAQNRSDPITAVLAIHERHVYRYPGGGTDSTCLGCTDACMYCEGDHPWPCPTVQAIADAGYPVDGVDPTPVVVDGTTATPEETRPS